MTDDLTFDSKILWYTDELTFDSVTTKQAQIITTTRFDSCYGSSPQTRGIGAAAPIMLCSRKQEEARDCQQAAK